MSTNYFDDAKAIFDVMISMLVRHKWAPNDNIVLPILTLIAVLAEFKLHMVIKGSSARIKMQDVKKGNQLLNWFTHRKVF